jgi:hypothetical protein
MEGPLYRLLISSPSVLSKHGCQRKFLFLVGRFLKIFPHCMCRSHFILLWGNLIQNLPLVLPTKYRFILAKQFQWGKIFKNLPTRNKNFLWRPRGQFLKIFLSETALPKWTDIWWEAPSEGSVLNFLKAEWKMSDRGSAHWASSFFFSSPGHRPCELLSWVSVRCPSVSWSFLQNHNSISLMVSDKKIFKISANENTLWTMAAMLDFKSAPKTQIW